MASSMVMLKRRESIFFWYDRNMNRTVEEMLQSIDSKNQPQAIKLWSDLTAYLPKAMGSTKSHHSWDYGYKDHVQEVMNLAYELYESLNRHRPLEFSLESALLVLFLHDCEKPFRHASSEQLMNFSWIIERPTKSDKDFQDKLLAQYGFDLNDHELNGLKYVEGENEDYVEGERTQGPLAAFCHVCDTVSARIWYDHPKQAQ
jgi:hypothetical protein